jgi:hypothetical protein
MEGYNNDPGVVGVDAAFRALTNARHILPLFFQGVLHPIQKSTMRTTFDGKSFSPQKSTMLDDDAASSGGRDKLKLIRRGVFKTRRLFEF